MRPFSKYLDDFKHENVDALYHVEGSTPPLGSWLKKQKITYRFDQKDLAYETLKLKKHIASLARTQPENITLVPGSTQALFQTLAALTEPGDNIIIEHPAYEPYLATARFLGLNILRFQRKQDFESSFVELKKVAPKAKILLLSNPHCPTGWMFSAQEVNKILELGLTVVIDEFFLPLFQASQISLHKDLKNLNQMVYLSSLSKSTGLGQSRIGWIISNPSNTQKVARMGLHLHIDFPSPLVYLGNFVFQNWLKITRELLQLANKNRKFVTEFYNDNQDLLSHSFKNGYYGVLRAPRPFGTGAQFTQALIKKNIFVRDAAYFEMPEHIRFHILQKPREFQKIFSQLKSYY